MSFRKVAKLFSAIQTHPKSVNGLNAILKIMIVRIRNHLKLSFPVVKMGTHNIHIYVCTTNCCAYGCCISVLYPAIVW